jgi:hypothetical protein
VEEAFWRFIDQKWKDLLNVALDEPQGNKARLEARRLATEGAWRSAINSQGKLPEVRLTESKVCIIRQYRKFLRWAS